MTLAERRIVQCRCSSLLQFILAAVQCRSGGHLAVYCCSASREGGGAMSRDRIGTINRCPHNAGRHFTPIQVFQQCVKKVVRTEYCNSCYYSRGNAR